MSNQAVNSDTLLEIQYILSFQYNALFSSEFFKCYPHFSIKFSSRTGKIKQLFFNHQTIATYKPPTGMFSLSFNAIQQILLNIPPPQFRVKVLSEVAPYIAQGKSAFAKHVIEVDPNLRAGDEVFVVDEKDHLLAIGKLALPPTQIPWMQNGIAVKIRHSEHSRLDETENNDE